VNLALVLWRGDLGGAERFTAGLAAQFRTMGVAPTVVFIGPDRPLSALLERDGIEYHSLDLARGSSVLWHPKRLADIVGTFGSGGAILDSVGYVGVTLRTHGYTAPVVSVEHGALVEEGLPLRKRLVRFATRQCGAWAADVEVAVSDFMLNELLRHRHARQVVRIHNGVDLTEFAPRAHKQRDVFTVGWAGRMVWGKGLPELLQAAAILARRKPVEVRLAGDGPDRPAVAELAARLKIADAVVFAGQVLDLASFWSECDTAVFPTNGLLESFGLAAVEAMACGVPVVASRAGGLTEVVKPGTTGTLVDAGDVDGLVAALTDYALDPQLRMDHGRSARRECETRFDLANAARRYRALFEH
jgi:glycosyltransferase involved in cell wall biosynthesis